MNHTDPLDYWHSSTYRFSRYCGEKTVDGHYACALEGPRIPRRTIFRVWVGVIVVLAVALAVLKAM